MEPPIISNKSVINKFTGKHIHSLKYYECGEGKYLNLLIKDKTKGFYFLTLNTPEIINFLKSKAMPIREAIKRRGAKGYRAGLPIEANPYPEGTEEITMWELGWILAQHWDNLPIKPLEVKIKWSVDDDNHKCPKGPYPCKHCAGKFQ